MTDNVQTLFTALLAFATLRTPGRIAAALRAGGRSEIDKAAEGLDNATRVDTEAKAHSMDANGIGAVLFGDSDFPESLIQDGKPMMPIIFYKGNKDLLYADGVGMCGSRHVSPQGLIAAERCGEAVSHHNLTIVSGYAQGVDTATHLAALQSGGRTVIVLAEGMDFFRIKKNFAKDFDPDRTLVLSQFAPSQTWQAHAAMARNAIIFGLSKALVVIEAGEKGGTLAAGQGAMKIGRPVLVVDFGDRTPEGNKILLNAGAVPVASTGDLRRALDRVAEKPSEPETMVALF
jgi:DNA processing protein